MVEQHLADQQYTILSGAPATPASFLYTRVRAVGLTSLEKHSGKKLLRMSVAEYNICVPRPFECKRMKVIPRILLCACGSLSEYLC
jgi:hypothetical protein